MSDSMAGVRKSSSRSHPPFAQPGVALAQPREMSSTTVRSIDDFLDRLPSIDEFLLIEADVARDLPSIDDYLDDAADRVSEDDAYASPQPDYDADGWAIAGWQSFDWGGAAALGISGDTNRPAKADPRDWGIQEPSKPAARPANRSDHIPPTADEVACALDGLARRIRSGELVIDQFIGTPPEAAMASALAAMLRMRG